MKGQTQKITVIFDDGDDEGLALLIPDIRETSLLVRFATKIDLLSSANANEQIAVDRPLTLSIDQRYLDIMKTLQFGNYDYYSYYY